MVDVQFDKLFEKLNNLVDNVKTLKNENVNLKDLSILLNSEYYKDLFKSKTVLHNTKTNIKQTMITFSGIDLIVYTHLDNEIINVEVFDKDLERIEIPINIKSFEIYLKESVRLIIDHRNDRKKIIRKENLEALSILSKVKDFLKENNFNIVVDWDMDKKIFIFKTIKGDIFNKLNLREFKSVICGERQMKIFFELCINMYLIE